MPERGSHQISAQKVSRNDATAQRRATLRCVVAPLREVFFWNDEITHAPVPATFHSAQYTAEPLAPLRGLASSCGVRGLPGSWSPRSPDGAQRNPE